MVKPPRKSATERPKAFSYIRFSTPEQAQGDSLRRQVEGAEAYATEHGLELDSSLRDEGISGFRGKHRRQGALGTFLRMVQEKRIPTGSFLLVENLDRLSREHPLDSVDLVRQIVLQGISIVIVPTGQIYSEATLRADPMVMMGLIFELGRGAGESQRKSFLLSKAWAKKRANAATKPLGRICPEWLRLADDRTCYVEIPERVEVVRDIFRLYNDGWGKRRIGDHLQASGIEPWGRGKKRAEGWHYSYIDKILHSRAVLGCYQPHKLVEGKRVPDGDEISGYYPQVIDHATWAAVHSKRTPRTGGPTSRRISNLFAGLVYDLETNAPMVYVEKGTATRGAGRWRYLQTAPVAKASRRLTWNYLELEYAILGVLRELDWGRIAGESTPPEVATMANKVAELEAEAESLAKKVSNMLDKIGDGDAPDSAMQRVREWEQQAAQATAQAAIIRGELEAVQARVARISQGQDELKELIEKALDRDAWEFRLRLREEIRSRVSKILLKPFEWPPSHPWRRGGWVFLGFANGAIRNIEILPADRGWWPEIRIYEINEANEVTGFGVLPGAPKAATEP